MAPAAAAAGCGSRLRLQAPAWPLAGFAAAAAAARLALQRQDQLSDGRLVAGLDVDLRDLSGDGGGTSTTALSVSISRTGWSLAIVVADGDQHLHHVAGFDVLAQFGKSEFDRHVVCPPVYEIIGFRFSGLMSRSFIARETTSGLILLVAAPGYESVATAM